MWAYAVKSLSKRESHLKGTKSLLTTFQLVRLSQTLFHLVMVRNWSLERILTVFIFVKISVWNLTWVPEVIFFVWRREIKRRSCCSPILNSWYTFVCVLLWPVLKSFVRYYDADLITDEDFIILYELCSSRNPDFAYFSYDRFHLDNMNDDEFKGRI